MSEGRTTAAQVRATGMVRFYDEAKGFGFIAMDGGDDNYFFHSSTWPDDLEEPEPGQRVTFEQAKDPRGGKTRARNVKPL